MSSNTWPMFGARAINWHDLARLRHREISRAMLVALSASAFTRPGAHLPVAIGWRIRGISFLLLPLVSFGSVATAANPIDYEKQVKPIFAARCYACHSALRKKSGLRLDTAALLIEGGDSGAAVEPGHADDSLLITMLTGESGTRMPPEGEGEALHADQIDLIKQWINEGAVAPAESPAPDPRDHWAYKPPKRPAVPTVRDPAWSGNPIDAFLASGYESAGRHAAGCGR